MLQPRLISHLKTGGVLLQFRKGIVEIAFFIERSLASLRGEQPLSPARHHLLSLKMVRPAVEARRQYFEVQSYPDSRLFRYRCNIDVKLLEIRVFEFWLVRNPDLTRMHNIWNDRED